MLTSRVHMPPPSPKVAADHFLDIGERDRRDHRAEDLLLRDAHLVANTIRR
jgi:hypothetical protein